MSAFKYSFAVCGSSMLSEDSLKSWLSASEDLTGGGGHAVELLVVVELLVAVEVLVGVELLVEVEVAVLVPLKIICWLTS